MNSGVKTQLIPHDTYPNPVSFQPGVNFGLYTDDGGSNTYYTESSRNPDSLQHARIFRVDTDDDASDTKDGFAITFEDTYDLGDKDYNDVVVQLKGQGLNAIPESSTVVTLIETAVIDAVDIITSIDKLHGCNGMIAKLQNVVDEVSDAVIKYGDGISTQDEYLTQLNKCLNKLNAFDQQLEAKATMNKPQISSEEADLLRSLSSDIQTLIQSLIDNA